MVEKKISSAKKICLNRLFLLILYKNINKYIVSLHIYCPVLIAKAGLFFWVKPT